MRYSVPTDDPTYELPGTASPPISEICRSIEYSGASPGVSNGFNSDPDEFDESRQLRSLRGGLGNNSSTFDSQSFISAGTATSSSNSLPSVRTTRSGNDDQVK